MEILRWEPSVVVVGLTLADARILSQGIEVETFLEPGCNDGRYEHAAALRSAFQGIVEALRLQERVIDQALAKTRGNRMTRDEIIDRLGADTWGQVLDAFGGLDRDAILAKLNDIFEHDDNAELARSLAEALSED
jgi:hypothetical protein